MQEITNEIDATALPKDEKLELVKDMMDSIKDDAEIRHNAILGRLEPGTLTVEWQGDDLAEAKGRSFKTRDIIEDHTDYTASVEFTGTIWHFPTTTFYEFEMEIED